MSFPRISIIIITYNQENVIKRALDSILIQKEWVYEIIVADDCSTDLNWEIIKDYEAKFPQIIKPYRNIKNLGIFSNYESTWCKVNGDIIISLSGDDEICDGLLCNIINLIREKNIDFKTESFCLYFDYKMEMPDKFSKVFRNNLIEKEFDPLSLKLRGLISVRTTAVSSSLFKSYTRIRKDIGIYADGLLDIQVQQHSKANYYKSFVGSVYYAGIGVSKTTARIEHLNSIIMYYNELSKLILWSKKDQQYIEYKINRAKFQKDHSFSVFMRMIFNYIKSIDLNYGLYGFKLNQTLFAVIRKIKSKI